METYEWRFDITYKNSYPRSQCNIIIYNIYICINILGILLVIRMKVGEENFRNERLKWIKMKIVLGYNMNDYILIYTYIYI